MYQLHPLYYVFTRINVVFWIVGIYLMFSGDVGLGLAIFAGSVVMSFIVPAIWGNRELKSLTSEFSET